MYEIRDTMYEIRGTRVECVVTGETMGPSGESYLVSRISSVDLPQLRPGIIAQQDLAVALPCAGPGNGTPLAHPHAVTVAATLSFNAFNPATGARDSRARSHTIGW